MDLSTSPSSKLKSSLKPLRGLIGSSKIEKSKLTLADSDGSSATNIPKPSSSPILPLSPRFASSSNSLFLNKTSSYIIFNSNSVLLGQNLTKIDISFCNEVNDVFLENLSKRVPNIKKLNLNSCSKVTDLGIFYISQLCHELKWISLEECELLTDDTIRFLCRGCFSLSFLSMFGCEKRTKNAMLHIACAEGNESLVKFFINNHVNVNQISPEHSPSHSTPSSSSSSNVPSQSPLSSTSPMFSSKNSVTGFGCLTPLMVAAFAGFDNICNLLVLNGAYINYLSSFGWTALKFHYRFISS
jgi:hypothetical protein